MNSKFLPSIIAAVSVLLFFLLVLPAFDKTRMLRDSIREREEILKETEELSARVGSINREIESRSSDVDKLDRLLPKEKEIPEILSGIESIVSGSGLALSEMNLSDVSGQDQIRKINGTMKLSGGYSSFVGFLDLFEKNLRLTGVAALDVAAQLAGGTRTLNYDVRFEVNYLAEQ